MRQIAMSDQIMQVLKPALTGAKGTIKREIKDGISKLYQASNGRLIVVLRAEGNQLVVVAVAGSKLYQSRQEIITFARFNQFTSIRFHTKHPERLTRGLAGLPIAHVETRHSIIGRDELIYILEL